MPRQAATPADSRPDNVLDEIYKKSGPGVGADTMTRHARRTRVSGETGMGYSAWFFFPVSISRRMRSILST